MLDSETKRRIDAARDTLVGRVPDPKSQVEQITIALIYKFMADMDNRAEELGGKRSFFAGDFEQYRWENLMSPRMGGHDMLNLYVAAITRMNKNPGIPQLFRDIFKSAYLPFNNPETLRGFLKIIDDFQYDHSERLGDAFEYLLSVLGSQGNAGQFRTPRHIIDFMVDIIAPRKSEKILDPACGTAGFLISAWKYINQTNARDGKPGAALTPDERKELARNVFGYDISPDMVRLSLVNMYLHGFAEPHIYEYDSLTSVDRWDEAADVILANPPFMSPKGGICPHGRFSIQANRSEVLFVDYIAEHLSSHGRAAVIVPEGIIFQSGRAYKQLRKMLVEKYLLAVVSLPAGVFNPYSGVKTSILFMDKSLAKKSVDVFFVKVENDGFDLGAQRRPIDKNDLPQSAAQVKAYLHAVKSDAVRDMQAAPNTLVVAKDKINESVDWNLSGSLYRESDVVRRSDWPMVKLGTVCDVIAGQSPEGKYYNDKRDGIPFYQGKTEFTDKFLGEPKKWTTKVTKKAQAGDIVMSVRAPVGPVNLVSQEICIGRGLAAIRVREEIDSDFLFFILKGMQNKIKGNAGAVFDSINRKDVERIQIPLPSLKIQQEIVAELNGYQKIIDGARQVVENYMPRVAVDSDWSFAKLGDICEFNPKKSEVKTISGDTAVSFVPMSVLNEHQISFKPQCDKKLSEVYSGYTYFADGDVLVARVTPCFENGKSGIAENLKNGIGFGSSELFVYRAKPGKTLAKWVYYHVSSQKFLDEGQETMTGTGGLQRVSKEWARNYRIPCPPLETQRKIVADIEEEEKMIHSNKVLIRSFERKIKAKIATVWGATHE